MKEEANNSECVRHDDLVAYLYNEMPDVESRKFRNHLLECSSCETELSAFANVREEVVAWRNESLGAVGSLTTEVAQANRVPARPSAIAALREFFNLSPAWMKGATVFASLLFCLLAVLAVARLMETPTSPLAKNGTVNARSDQEIDAIVERRVQEALQKQQTSSSSDVAQQPSPVRPNVIRSRPAIDKARRPLTKVERQELAADLRLINVSNDGEPQLLSDQINQ